MTRRTLVALALCLALAATAAWAATDWLFIANIPDQEAEKAQLWTYQVEVFSRSGCSTSNLDYWLSGGDVPAGMTISNTGLISYTPDDLDAFTLTVNVLGYCPGVGGDTDTETFKLTIA